MDGPGHRKEDKKVEEGNLVKFTSEPMKHLGFTAEEYIGSDKEAQLLVPVVTGNDYTKVNAKKHTVLEQL